MITVFVIGLLSIPSIAQNTDDNHNKKVLDVPGQVKQAFIKEFPGAKDLRWGMEDGEYEAEFKLNGTVTSANYDKKGHRTELETDINVNQLPKAALEYINKNYPAYQIKEASKVLDDKNTVTYEAELNQREESFELVFDSNGKYLNLEKEED